MPTMNASSYQAQSLYPTMTLAWVTKNTGMSEQPTARFPTPHVKMANDLTVENDICAQASMGTDSSSG